MLKHFVLLAIFGCCFQANCAEKKPIYPLIADEFGVPIRVKAKIESKLVDNKVSYTAQIIEMDGAKLKEPITVSCGPFETALVQPKLSKAGMEGNVYELVGYETLKMTGLPNGIKKQLPDFVTPHMTSFATHHHFVILDIPSIK